MRNLQNVNKTSVDQNLREEVANLEGMVLSFETYFTVERQIFSTKRLKIVEFLFEFSELPRCFF